MSELITKVPLLALKKLNPKSQPPILPAVASTFPKSFTLKNSSLKKTINSMEKAKDQKQIWRKYVNDQLKSKYKKLYSQLNCLIYLKAKNFSLLQKWRLKQERKLWVKSKVKSNLKIMSRGDVINFMQTYQRITQNMFKNMPKYASIIFNLNSNHQIKSALYRNK